MAQSINIKIAGKDYPLVAADPEKERVMRLAAEDLNNMLSRYDERFPDKPMLDKLAFVALNEAVGKINARKELAQCSSEATGLESEMKSYLEGLENNR